MPRGTRDRASLTCVPLGHGLLSFSRQIKVAVSADRDCIRAYQPQISSSNYNTLTLNVKTQEPDNLLFYLGSSTSVSERPWEFGNTGVSLVDPLLMKTST